MRRGHLPRRSVQGDPEGPLCYATVWPRPNRAGQPFRSFRHRNTARAGSPECMERSCLRDRMLAGNTPPSLVEEHAGRTTEGTVPGTVPGVLREESLTVSWVSIRRLIGGLTFCVIFGPTIRLIRHTTVRPARRAMTTPICGAVFAAVPVMTPTAVQIAVRTVTSVAIAGRTRASNSGGYQEPRSRPACQRKELSTRGSKW